MHDRWRAIHITRAGWEIVEHPQILLQRGEFQVREKLGKEDVFVELLLAWEALLSGKGEIVGFSVVREDDRGEKLNKRVGES